MLAAPYIVFLIVFTVEMVVSCLLKCLPFSYSINLHTTRQAFKTQLQFTAQVFTAQLVYRCLFFFSEIMYTLFWQVSFSAHLGPGIGAVTVAAVFALQGEDFSWWEYLETGLKKCSLHDDHGIQTSEIGWKVPKDKREWRKFVAHNPNVGLYCYRYPRATVGFPSPSLITNVSYS